jgi:hypothetical protein
MLNAAEKRKVFERIAYTPNEAQAAIHNDPSLVKLLAGGERAGKSRFGAAELIGNSPDGSLFWLVGPDYEQARPEFMYALEDAQRLQAVENVSMPAEGKLSMRLYGGIEIETKTGEEAMKLAGKAPTGILMVEAAQQPYQNFLKLFARTAEGRARGDGWLLLTGTFERALGWYPEFFKMFQGPNPFGGRSFSLPTWSNTAVFPGGREDPAIKAMESALPPDIFLERFGGEPAAPVGVVFPEFRHTVHVVPIRFGDTQAAARDERDERGWVLPKQAEVEVWIDPGYAGAYAVLFVVIDDGLVFVVDEVYAKGQTAEQVILACQRKRDLWARVKRGVIDIAGNQHQGMESHVEIWQRSAGISLASDRLAIVDGIGLHRGFLVDPLTKVPRLFHDPKCVGAIAEYGRYRYPNESPNRDERELPIDRDNHAMKAIAYGLFQRFGWVSRKTRNLRPRNLIEERWGPDAGRGFGYDGARREDAAEGALRVWRRAKQEREEARDAERYS